MIIENNYVGQTRFFVDELNRDLMAFFKLCNEVWNVMIGKNALANLKILVDQALVLLESVDKRLATVIGLEAELAKTIDKASKHNINLDYTLKEYKDPLLVIGLINDMIFLEESTKKLVEVIEAFPLHIKYD